MLRTALIASLLAATPALAAEWTVDPAASRIEFSFSQGSNITTGQFERFKAEIRFDPADLANAAVRAEIDIASFNSGNPQIDGAVSGSDWFATSQFPTASFLSSAFEQREDGTYAITGDLTIRDATVPVTLTGPITIEDGRATAIVEVELDRSAHGVGQGDFASDTQVGHAVPVTITIVASAAP